MAGPMILVVDDERNIVQLVKLYLRQEGYQVETAANGREAIEKAKQFRPNLIVLDLMMPEVDGWEVCKQLRRGGDVPIIMLTARASRAAPIRRRATAEQGHSVRRSDDRPGSPRVPRRRSSG